mmetsp:Transcript_6932/g.21623  ORF Transcript_6932/g.21623 Transcript_6932/m.21623 type:complete len:112 (-) Transcript_6932:169-504(-)
MLRACAECSLLARVRLSPHDAHVGQRSEAVRPVHAVANHKLVGADEADQVGREVTQERTERAPRSRMSWTRLAMVWPLSHISSTSSTCLPASDVLVSFLICTLPAETVSNP